MTTVPALWLKHRPLARTIARDYFLPGAESQDVEQEALIALWVAATKYDGTSPFEAWARMVVSRHLITCVQAATTGRSQILNTSMREFTTEDGYKLDAPDVLPHLHQVSDRCEEREEVRELLAHIAELPPFQRHCVISLAAGLTYPEIDPNTKRVDNALARARKTLRSAA